MSVEVKICGIRTQEAMDAALENEVDYVGLNFYPPSPRFITPKDAAKLVANVPELVVTTGLVVDPSDEMLEVILKTVQIDLLQLHGSETPDRVDEIREKFEISIAKALPVATKEDMRTALDYEDHVDLLIFDAKPPKQAKPGREVLPGGNGEAFDWQIMQDVSLECAWMLSGGLTPANVVGAVELTNAEAVDVSSGVENKFGEKDPELIAAFLNIAHGIGMEQDGYTTEDF
ncbi:MAG: phosphoribosylanthranilate isomerase [Alphaproteobacteria bacterium]